MGVPEVWIFDPDARSAQVLRNDTATKHPEGTLRLEGTLLQIDLVKLFAVLGERSLMRPRHSVLKLPNQSMHRRRPRAVGLAAIRFGPQ
jgi:hypothetical protein